MVSNARSARDSAGSDPKKPKTTLLSATMAANPRSAPDSGGSAPENPKSTLVSSSALKPDSAASKSLKPKKLQVKKKFAKFTLFAAASGVQFKKKKLAMKKKICQLEEELASTKNKLALMKERNTSESLYKSILDSLSIKADLISEMESLFKNTAFFWISRSLKHVKPDFSVKVTEDIILSLKDKIEEEINCLSSQPSLCFAKKNKVQARMRIILSNLRKISFKASKAWVSSMEVEKKTFLVSTGDDVLNLSPENTDFPVGVYFTSKTALADRIDIAAAACVRGFNCRPELQDERTANLDVPEALGDVEGSG